MREIRNCNVAVVGGAGFLGSHLVQHLAEERGCFVLVVDNFVATRQSSCLLGHISNSKWGWETHDIGAGDERYLRGIFNQHNISYVFNYAAVPYVPDSYRRPLYVFNVNAMGALKVINAAQEAGVNGILQVSSAELYGDAVIQGYERRGSGKINELAVVEPHSTYGAAKAAIDSLVQTRYREAKTPVIALRQFNCVGERETHPYVVPEIISQLFHNYHPEGKTVVRLGNNSYRDFLYAGDAVAMATELLEKGEFGQVYNLGSEEGIKIYDLAQLLSDIIGCGKVTIEVEEQRKRVWEIWHLQSDNSKLYKVIERRPQLSLRQALERTVEYYRQSGKKWCWES